MISERDNSFTNLTKCQVEALLECFDFLRNGYVQILDWSTFDTWINTFRHKDNRNRIWVEIRKNWYVIKKNGKIQKSVTYNASSDRYRLFVNSDMSVGVVRLKHGVDETLIKGSLSTNKDAQ